jgi:substrate import-associated zinc metallohydrolase lipoprotein
MLKINFRILIAFLILATGACDDAYNDINDSDYDFVSNDDPSPPTGLDSWLSTTFTLPYNIEVKYKWDNSEQNPYQTLVPPAVEKVQAVMGVVKNVWIDPYGEIAGADFIKTYSPKQFVLVGSASYNFDGSFTLGTADGGRKVVLYVINNFDQDNHQGVKSLVHTIQHEFGHILHQTIAYPNEFKEITSGQYTANWTQVPIEQARAQGFITNYAMSSPDEDFVEMIAVMLVEGKNGYERILACETNPASKNLLRQKEQIVIEYFRKHYNIDFYELQDKVQEAIEEFAPAPPTENRPPVLDVWGYQKEYASIRFDLNFMNLPQNFTARWASDYNKMQRKDYGLNTYFRLYFVDTVQVRLQQYFYKDSINGRIFYEANFTFDIFIDDEGRTAFGYVDGDDNARLMVEECEAYAILEYFTANSFELDWERSSCPSSQYVGFYPVNVPNPGSTFGELAN